MASKTYVRRFGKNKQHEQGVTVHRLPGMVIEHPFDDIRGGGYGRKHPTRDVRRTARAIERGLLAAGYVLREEP
jgi:hypothetical protein